MDIQSTTRGDAMNSSSTTQTFYPFFEECTTKVLGTVLWILHQTLGSFLLIMSRELKINDKSLTLLDMVMLNCTCIQWVYHVVVVNTDLLRLWWGPLPEAVCTVL